MEILERMGEQLLGIVPPAIAILVVALVLFVARLVAIRMERKRPGLAFRNQLILLGLTLAGLVAVILALPVKLELRGQVLSFLGILLSAAIALSSTTFLGNALAGLMLRAVRGFAPGDFLRVGEHFGRVTDRGLVRTEIQTEDRDLTTLPNLHLVTNPFTVIRSSGTIVSATVSLGYDVSRREVELCLLEAAEAAGLQEPFVQVVELGDFSVVYRAAGLLPEVKQIVTVRSNLREAMLDALHGHGVEIVSPTVMTTRAIPPDARIVPLAHEGPEADVTAREGAGPESVIFDKAEEAEDLARRRGESASLLERIEALRKEGKAATSTEVRARLERDLAELEAQRAALDAQIEERERGLREGDAPA